MKKITYNLSILLGLFLIFSCDDPYEDNSYEAERVEPAQQVAPSAGSTIQLNAGTPNANIEFSWREASAGLGGDVTYEVLVDVANGDFSSPLLIQDVGSALSTSITHNALNDMASSAGTDEFAWKVRATSGTNAELSEAASAFKLEAFGEGIQGFSYTFPEASQKILVDKIRTPNDEIVVSWESTTSTSGADITYAFQAHLDGGSFDDPLIELPSDNEGAGNTLTLTHAQLADALAGVDIGSGFFWRIVATAGDFSYSPGSQFLRLEIFDVPTLFALGDATTAGWNNNETDPIPFTRGDGGIFTLITTLEGGKHMKFILERGSWDVNWGGEQSPDVVSEAGIDYNLGSNDIQVPETGTYTITVNFANGTYRLDRSELYLVGGGTDAGWNPGASIPFRALPSGGFELYAYLYKNGQGGFKFLIQQDWPGDYGMRPGSPGELLQEGEDNIPEPDVEGMYRINVDLGAGTYSLTHIPAVYVVGGATTIGWNPDQALELTYDSTERVYKLTTDLIGGQGFKFIMQRDWGGAFDWSGENGVLRYGGDIAFAGPDGTYEIIVDLTNWTYSINN